MKGMSKKHFLTNSLILGTLLLVFSCSRESTIKLDEQDIAIKWADLSLHVTQYTPANSPTFASRCLGYIGLTMYESIVHGFPNYNSMAGQLNELNSLPVPDLEQPYFWELALNAGQASILKSLYVQTADSNKVKIDSLESLLHKSLITEDMAPEAINRSVEYGRSVANAIFEWSKNDGGHRGYLFNFDKEWEHPKFPGSWKPPLYSQSFSHHPLHPHWGKNRTFVAKNAEISNPVMIPYDTTAGSPLLSAIYGCL